MRDTFVRALTQIARRDPKLLLLTGDLGFGVLTKFAEELSHQFINVGVAEQNLTGLATGLALSGHTVYTYSIANFPTLRCLEQIRNDACYHNANVKIVAVGAGFSYGPLGVSHHATEDLAILRSLPCITVFSPCDLEEVEAAASSMHETPGVCYLRLDKSYAPQQPHADIPTIGRIRRLTPGTDIVIFGTGGILAEALEAAATLLGEGVQCGVFSVNTLKPIDVEGIVGVSRSASIVVTLEEHTIDGGLGSCVAEVLADHGSVPRHFRRLGLKSEFSSIVGTQSYLRQAYGLNATALIETIRQARRALV